VFCQHTRKAALRCVLSNFTGAKLVLRGGELAANTVASMLFHYLRKYKGDQFSGTSSGALNQVGDVAEESDLLILHFVAVTTGVSARLALVRSIIDVKPSGTERDVSRVRELAVDTDTFGLLGAAILLRSLQVIFFFLAKYNVYSFSIFIFAVQRAPAHVVGAMQWRHPRGRGLFGLLWREPAAAQRERGVAGVCAPLLPWIFIVSERCLASLVLFIDLTSLCVVLTI